MPVSQADLAAAKERVGLARRDAIVVRVANAFLRAFASKRYCTIVDHRVKEGMASMLTRAERDAHPMFVVDADGVRRPDRLAEVRALRRRIGNQRRALRLLALQLAEQTADAAARRADDDALETAVDSFEIAPLFDGDRELSLTERAVWLLDRAVVYEEEIATRACRCSPCHGNDPDCAIHGKSEGRARS